MTTKHLIMWLVLLIILLKILQFQFIFKRIVCASLICMIYLKTQIMIQKIYLYILEKRWKKFQNLKI